MSGDLTVRAIVAARRAEDHRRDFDVAIDALRELGREIEYLAERLDKCSLATEGVLSLCLSVLPPPTREQATPSARELTEHAGFNISHLKEIGGRLAGALQLLDGEGEP